MAFNQFWELRPIIKVSKRILYDVRESIIICDNSRNWMRTLPSKLPKKIENDSCSQKNQIFEFLTFEYTSKKKIKHRRHAWEYGSQRIIYAYVDYLLIWPNC